MKPLTGIAHEFLRSRLHPGDCVIDATVGNGNDTHFLSRCVGPAGRVFAFDIQRIALERTAQLCAGFSNISLIERSHAEMREAIPREFHGRITVVVFNFGYLPGGDHAIVTRTPSSVEAIRAAAELLRPGGYLSAIVYPGHPGGETEAAQVEGTLRELPFSWVCESPDRPRAPRLWFGTRN